MSITLFCNLCLELQSEIKRRFVITSCSHVFCEACQVKNFCKLCNIPCKVMEIGENMPSEVKMYFETKSIERLGNNIQKISTFQENQVKFYFENTRQRQYAKKYQEIKENAMKLHSVKKKYTEMFRKEKQIIERLKQAYHSNRITPDLFELCTVRSPSSFVSMSTKPSPSPNKKSSPSNSSQSSRSSSRSVYKDTRKSLLETTLLQMQISSQMKFQAIHKKQFPK